MPNSARPSASSGMDMSQVVACLATARPRRAVAPMLTSRTMSSRAAMVRAAIESASGAAAPRWATTSTAPAVRATRWAPGITSTWLFTAHRRPEPAVLPPRSLPHMIEQSPPAPGPRVPRGGSRPAPIRRKLRRARRLRTYHSPVADETRGTALRVLVYSNDADTRSQVMLAVGTRPHPELPPLEFVEVATAPAVIEQLDAGGIDLAILDGEAAPAGGLGIAKQLKDELSQCPPILVLTGRPDDA